MKETDLYPPVKAWLEAQGFEAKAEIGAADVVACRIGEDGEDPVVVELKLGFSLTLLQQAVARQRLTDAVYVAVPRWVGKAGWRRFKANVGLCKRLGIGVMSVDITKGTIQVHSDPAMYRPRKSKPRKAALLKEFERRNGDPNQGGTRGSVVTGYQQEAERCADYLANHGASRGANVAKGAKVPLATRIMYDNHYGWFEKQGRGIYALSPAGMSRAKP
ncbi:DUF2161 family putative PD-(D/E)XK-type phosphodiesterase [Cognatishimia sp. WU-CL00825]|uniref:DUF2161 domain-containing phosphodiesterase n=1 Tax=Cognatishimia sp. WU-CL00825 TaxID=3127658 RepID=UPI00310AF657